MKNNETLLSVIKYTKKLEKEIPSILNDIINDLKLMVENEKIVSFSFLKNDLYMATQKPIYISLSAKNFSELRLGVFSSISEFEKQNKVKLPDNFKKDLENINSTLLFLNEHLIKKLPAINQQTYFSIKAVNKEGDFAHQNIPLFPYFEQPIKSKKVKIK